MSPRLTALLLLAVVALLTAPAAHAVTANTTLQINVTCTVTSTVRIQWDLATTLNSDGVAPATDTTAAVWAVGNREAGSAALNTVTGNPTFVVKNEGTARVDITAQVSGVSGLTYVVVAPTIDNFRISASNDGFVANDVVVPSASPVSVKTDLTVDGTDTVTIDLKIEVPVQITTASSATAATVSLVAAAG